MKTLPILGREMALSIQASQEAGGGGRAERREGREEGVLTGALVPHHHFVLSGEVWRLAQQLGLGDSDGTGCFSDQHGVVELCSSRSGWAQVSTLGTRGEKRVQRCSTFLRFSSHSQLVQMTGLCLTYLIP